MARKRNRWTWVAPEKNLHSAWVISGNGRVSGAVEVVKGSRLLYRALAAPDPGKPEGSPNNEIGLYLTQSQAKRALVRWLNGGEV